MKKDKQKNKTVDSIFSALISKLDEDSSVKVTKYFKDLEDYISLPFSDNKLIKQDLEKIFIYYLRNNVSVDEILQRIDLTNFGGFYARPSSLWLNMDEVAKMYSLFMGRSDMGVFRLSFYLKEDVIPEILQIALHFTIKRFPSFAVTLKRGLFWYYLDSVKRRFKVEEERGIPCQPINVSMGGSQTFRVIYYKNRISLEVFHGMTDGTGCLAFLKSLVKEYLVLLGANIPETTDVLEINDIPNSKELENSFRNLKLNGKTDSLINKSALQLGGKLSNKKPSKIIHFKMNTEKLISVVRSYNTTVTSFMISVIMLASKGSIDEVTGDISICCPVNLRKHFDSQTLRNFSVFSSIRTRVEDINSLEELIPYVTIKLKESITEESLINILTSTVGVTRKIGIIPLAFKRPIIKIGYNFFGDNQFTTNISNLGDVKMPKEMASYIESGDFVLGTAMTNRAVSTLISVNGVSTFTISKLTKDPSFEQQIYKILSDEGIDILVEGSESYER